MDNCQLLLVDDEPNIIKSIRRVLRHDSYTIHTANSANEALQLLKQTPIDVVVSDHRMPGKTGAELFCEVRDNHPSVVGIMLSGQADMDAVIQAVNDGNIYKFLHKPWSNEGLREVVREASQCAAKNKQSDNGPHSHLQFSQRVPLDSLCPSSGIVLIELRNANELRGRSDAQQCSQELLGKLNTLSQELLREIAVSPCELEGSIYALICNIEEREPIEALLQAIAHVSLGGERAFTPSFSIGYARLLENEAVDRCLRNALKALTSSKQSNTVTEYSHEIRNNLHLRQSLEQDMRQGLENGEFFLQLQPQVSTSNGEIVGAESLCRWVHNIKGAISPELFIDLAEETGFINQLGLWVIEEGCKILSQVHSCGKHNCRISINVSPRQFSQRTWVDLVLNHLQSQFINPSLLELEITESTIMCDAEHAKAILRELQSAGVRIAMDDFGTGHSSLGQISDLHIDVLKLDRSLIMNIEHDAKSYALLKNIVRMAQDIGMETIAEGVETARQAEICVELGCTLIQGYAFYKPMDVKEFLRL